MFVLQLGRSRTAWLLLVTSVPSALVFATLAGTQRDWLAAALSLACSLLAVRMVVLLLRRRALARAAVAVLPAGVERSPAVPNVLFMTHGFQSVGARSRDGVIVIGESGAAFLPTSGWRFVAAKFFVSLLVHRIRFVDLVVDVPAGADVSAALEETAKKHGGFFIDDGWKWTASMRWLSRPDVQGVGVVTLARPPPPHVTARWAATAPPSAATLGHLLRRVATVGLVAATAMFVVGYVAWTRTGDADYLVAGTSYAALTMIATLGGVWLAKRRLGEHARRTP